MVESLREATSAISWENGHDEQTAICCHLFSHARLVPVFLLFCIISETIVLSLYSPSLLFVSIWLLFQ